MSCGVGHRRGLDLALLWLWCRPAATAPIRPLALELPYATGAALKGQNTKDKKKKNGKSRHPYLITDLRRKTFNFFAIECVSCRFVVYDLYKVEVNSLYTHFVESFFYLKWMLNFVKFFSASIEKIICFLYFIF